MATPQAFELRKRGDTTPDGRLRDSHAAMNMRGTEPELEGRFSFPFAFPRQGRYRMWVQVKRSGRVHTADFEVNVR